LASCPCRDDLLSRELPESLFLLEDVSKLGVFILVLDRKRTYK